MSNDLRQNSDDLQAQKPPRKRRKFIRVIFTVLCVLIFVTGVGIVILGNWIKPAAVPDFAVIEPTSAAETATPPVQTATPSVDEVDPAVTQTPTPTPTPTLIPPAPEGFSSADRKDLFYTFLIVGLDDYNNTDTLILASYDGVNNTANLIGVPRDCEVDASRELKKINAAYPIGALNGGGKQGGMTELQKEIKSIIGFIPDFYILVNFQAVTDTVDTVGGIEVDVPFHMVYDDPVQDLHIDIPKGMQLLNGYDALRFARYRKGNNGLNTISDYDRIKNQQTVIKAVLDKLIRPRNILRIPQFIQIFNDNVYSNITTGNMIWFANEIHKINSAGMLSEYTMPTNGSSGEPMYYEYLDEAKVLDMVNQTINPYKKDIQAKDIDIIRTD